jgi:myo-inositol-1-phosphate synthase
MPPSQLLTWAALQEGVPVVNATPNATIELPWAQGLATARGVPTAGSDLKTGQTLLKSVIAPALRQRRLGVRGWYSTNLLGNRDGEVLRDEGAYAEKARSKREVLDAELPAELDPDLYAGLEHLVRIDYYPPRGDNKESWDNIDLVGWMDAPMQLKLNFLCRDSILAAPLVLDLVLWLDLAARAGRAGVQDWLGFYFKSPAGSARSHALTRQHDHLLGELARLGAALR